MLLLRNAFCLRYAQYTPAKAIWQSTNTPTTIPEIAPAPSCSLWPALKEELLLAPAGIVNVLERTRAQYLLKEMSYSSSLSLA